MKLLIKSTKVINIIALCCLIMGAYGLILTGALQVLAGVIFFIAFPKDKYIHVYLGSVTLFFIFWKVDTFFEWQFIIPILLMIYLTYIIHFKKI